MAVRQDEDRRVGGGSEKLLTLTEAARRLKVTSQNIETLIRERKLTAFRLGGNLLRVQVSEVDLLVQQGWKPSPRSPREPKVVAPAVPPPVRPASGSIPTLENPVSVSPPSFWGRISDFMYFNDFYLVAFLMILTLLTIIFTL